jgi:hypothetical protein
MKLPRPPVEKLQEGGLPAIDEENSYIPFLGVTIVPGLNRN